MYSNNIVNFQESTTILNAYTKKSGNLLKAPLMFAVSLVEGNNHLYSIGPWAKKKLFKKLASQNVNMNIQGLLFTNFLAQNHLRQFGMPLKLIKI